MDLSMDVDIHGSYPPNTSTWMWSVLSMDIQLDIHPLPSLAEAEACLEDTTIQMQRKVANHLVRSLTVPETKQTRYSTVSQDYTRRGRNTLLPCLTRPKSLVLPSYSQQTAWWRQ
jgi:hypothetical protein